MRLLAPERQEKVSRQRALPVTICGEAQVAVRTQMTELGAVPIAHERTVLTHRARGLEARLGEQREHPQRVRCKIQDNSRAHVALQVARKAAGEVKTG